MNHVLVTDERNRGVAIVLNEATFGRVVRLASTEAGLMIAPTKTALVQSRLMRRLRAIGLTSFSDYLDLVESEDGRDELRQMISVLTTNVSHFYRERHHFEILRANILPRLVKRAAQGGSVRIWSAGCSSGQEPYSIAMDVLRLDQAAAGYDIRVLATDIDPAILDAAREAVFTEDLIQGVPEHERGALFEARQGRRYRVRKSVRDLVTFRELNLMAPWPMKRQFDVIFCRNVVIYFHEATQRTLWPRFRDALAPGGILFLGHSERVQELPGLNLKSIGVTAYRREDGQAPGHLDNETSERQRNGT